MPNILITGGTGLIGTSLTRLFLDKGYSVTILTRNRETAFKQLTSAEKQNGNTNTASNNREGFSVEHSFQTSLKAGNLVLSEWNPNDRIIDAFDVKRADYIINLAGAGIAGKRWTTKRKREILASRVNSGETIVKAIRDIPNSIKAVINSSAIGWYGHDEQVPNPAPFTETDAAGGDFLAGVCKQWEGSIAPVQLLNKRLVIVRTAPVLSLSGGALPRFITPLKFGIASILGNGKQVMSWIHINDLANIYCKAVQDESMNGVYNAAAPHPVTNKTLVLTLAKHIRGKFYIPVYVPSFVLKTVFGELSAEVLKSVTVSGEKLQKSGFSFEYPWIEDALKAMHIK